MATQLAARRRGPFILASTIFLVVTITVFRLPELFVDQLRRNRALTSAQSGWVYRLLALVAFGQAVYVAVVLLREDRVANAWRNEPKLSRMSRTELMDSIARSAALLPLLTLVYGLSAFALTGERAGFWLFVALTALQMLWSFRQAGQIGNYLDFQPEYVQGGDPGRADPASMTQGVDTADPGRAEADLGRADAGQIDSERSGSRRADPGQLDSRRADASAEEDA